MKSKIDVTKQLPVVIICIAALAVLFQVIGITSSGWLVAQLNYAKSGHTSALNNNSKIEKNNQNGDGQINPLSEPLARPNHRISRRTIPGKLINENADTINKELVMPVEDSPTPHVNANAKPAERNKTSAIHRPFFLRPFPVQPKEPVNNDGNFIPKESVNDKAEVTNNARPFRPMLRPLPTNILPAKPQNPNSPPIRPTHRPMPVRPQKPIDSGGKVIPGKVKPGPTNNARPMRPTPRPKHIQITPGRPQKQIDNGGKIFPEGNTNVNSRETNKTQPTTWQKKTLHEHPQKQSDNGGASFPKRNNNVNLEELNSTGQVNPMARQLPSKTLLQRPDKTIDNGGKTIPKDTAHPSTTSTVLSEIHLPQSSGGNVRPFDEDSNSTQGDSKNSGSIQINPEDRNQNSEEPHSNQLKDVPNKPLVQFPSKSDSPPLTARKPAMTGKGPFAKLNSSRQKQRGNLSQMGKTGNFRIGLWSSMVCQTEINGDEKCTQLTTRDCLLLMRSVIRRPLADDIGGVATWHNILIETIFALAAGAVGFVGTLLTVKPFCLKGRQRVTAIIGVIGLILSCILFLVPISRVASINQSLKNNHMYEQEVVQVDMPWAAAVSGIGACLAFLTAVSLAFFTWFDERHKWNRFEEDSAIVFKNDNKPKDEIQDSESKTETGTYDNLGTMSNI